MAASKTPRTSPALLLAGVVLGLACGESLEADSSGAETEAGSSTSGAVDASSSSSWSSGDTGSGGPVEESTGAQTGDPEDPPPVVDPWSAVADESLEVILGEVHTVYEPPASFNYGSFPFATSVLRGDGLPGSRALVTFSESPDASDAVIVTHMRATSDGGESYETVEGGVAMENATTLDDGSMLAVGFVPQWASGDTTATMAVSRSFDRGETWSTESGVFDTGGEVIRGLRFHRGLIQIPSGPNAGVLLSPIYALLGTDTTRTIELTASEDGGATWTRWGTIAPANDPVRTYDETSFEYARDGTMIAVTRAYEDGTLGPLLISRSDDDGRTFSAVEPIEIAFGDAAAAPRSGVDPGLLRMANGALLLLGGRADNWLAVSPDDGEHWGQGQLTYVNRSMNHPFHGSSGYQAIAALSSHRALIFGDNCANSWGCPESDSGWTIDGEYRIWGRRVDVVPADPGRVDLASAIASGQITVVTDLVAEDPELDALALVDGSLSPGSALRGSGEIEIDLGAPVDATRIAIAGAAGSTPAQLLLFDGEQWVDPDIETGSEGDRALVAFVPDQPRRVQRIRISTEAGGGISELELYTTTNSFENEALDSVPRAASEATMVTVVHRDDAPSSQMLRLHDTADDAMARVALPLPAGATAGSLRLRASALPGGMLLGLGDPSGSVLHLTIDAQGAVRRYGSATERWEPVAPAGTVDPFSWFDVTMRADGVLELGGAQIDTGPADPGTVDHLYVTSTGTIPVGVDLLIDDWTPQNSD